MDRWRLLHDGACATDVAHTELVARTGGVVGEDDVALGTDRKGDFRPVRG